MESKDRANDEKIKIKPSTTKELANLYEVSPRVFNTWIRPIQHTIGKREGHFYTANQVKVIIDHLGPYNIIASATAACVLLSC